jgi:hypothetical protein
MISTPLFTSNSARQRRPHGGLLAAVALFTVEGLSVLLPGKALLLAGVTSNIKDQINLDRPIQSGRCRRDHAPR